MSSSWAQLLLYANLVGHMVLFAGVVWCIAFPSRRIYPMARRDGWWVAMWALFGLVFFSNPVFVVLDWNTGLWPSPLRFWLAGPLISSGTGLVLWGMATLGARRTSGLPEALVAEGPYLLTRNPQYVGDFLLFVGVAIFANSGVVAVTHLLTALVLLLAPFAEEPWLESEYGEAYLAYRQRVPRYV
jgi:protein-S-isoprenylcysteine O-methyltransferase Ste14